MLDAQTVIALAAQCAPGIAPPTLLAIARTESGLEPLAIGVNRAAVQRRKPASTAEAVAAASALIAAGQDIDLGLAQINVRNLKRLGLSIEQAFDPCRNLSAAGEVLREGYARGVARHGPGQAALRVALSIYNTGHAERGIGNGYVARVLTHAGRPTAAASDAPAPATAPPAWDVFGRAAAAPPHFVFSAPGVTP
ncbi:lytic transglycosylase domain-containing protein [Phenylobacterium sp. J367]|uniref:lytic transglycosylase domain-containing protein n=1 Tax=Phenylobacterium sp. J367 TaxID=2898435 RepID=UPI002151C4BC|nr:lytic transglycosylase domain-containing protein [Phenylobacterium sp. J367]MCR5879671.1 lytic transglycosylase domain-containing protein [Phenylobacterium sp. J367]